MYFQKNTGCFFLSEDLLREEQLFYRNSSVFSISFTERKNNQFSSGFLSSHFPLITISRQRSDLWVLHILNKQFNPKGTGCKGIPCDHVLCSVRHPIITRLLCKKTRRSNTIHLACGFLGDWEGSKSYCTVWSSVAFRHRGKGVLKASSLLVEGFECEPYQNLQLKHIGIILGQMQESSESCS